MSIDPKVSMWINLAVTILSALTAASAQLTPLFGEGMAKNIIAISSLAVMLLGAINTGLHSTSSAEAGPLSK